METAPGAPVRASAGNPNAGGYGRPPPPIREQDAYAGGGRGGGGMGPPGGGYEDFDDM